jgi:aspartate/methionine/tyrosine aminotransferase
MGPAVNPLLSDTGTPPIPEAKAWLAAYDGGRGPAIDLSQAAPGHAPPAELLDALAEAAADPATAKYGPIRGEDSLREAYSAELGRAYGASFMAADSVMTSGCNQAFVMTMLAVAKAGDAVLLPAPWYFNHKMALDMLGIAGLITPRTRAIVLVTPNNPTGAVYPPDVIRGFSELARKHGIWLVLDETYRDFLPMGQDKPHDLFVHGVPAHVIQLYSFSKAYSIPGYRLGAVTAPRALMPDLAKVLDTVQICPARAGQIGVAKVMARTLAWREANRACIADRAQAFLRCMLPLNGWEVGSVGAYFAYVKPPDAEGGAAATARILALDHGVLALPGSYFGPGQEAWLRIAFANADESQIGALGARLTGAM